MFVLRNVLLKDLDDIHELSNLMLFINIPRDKEVLREKIEKSIECFKKPHKDLSKNIYIFVLEEVESEKVIGVSLIHALHGTEEEPHFYLKVGQENKYSQSLNTGFIHGTLRFGIVTKGFTEIGGLILSPEYRGHEMKLGKALSFCRFLYAKLHPERFCETFHVELMPPFDSQGNSPLWEAIGRKFLNMDYYDADLLSRDNKEFILSLYPHDTIYETLLPVEARNAIGKVGKSTLPVKKMIESIGFRYVKEVDPFDGGPHFRAQRDEITIIKQSEEFNIKFGKTDLDTSLVVQIPHENLEFYAPLVQGTLKGKNLVLTEDYKKIFKNSRAFGFSY